MLNNSEVIYRPPGVSAGRPDALMVVKEENRDAEDEEDLVRKNTSTPHDRDVEGSVVLKDGGVR